MKIPVKPSKLADLAQKLSGNDPISFLKMCAETPDSTYKGKYIHWDELRHKNMTDEEKNKLWAGMKFRRMGNYKEIPLRSTNDTNFVYGSPDCLQELLLYIDQHTTGGIQMPEQITNNSTRDRYIISSLVEEAIRSSQLEGAATTRKVAKEMIRSGRQPIDRSETMILNNYLTMRFIRKIKDETLTPELVLEIHKKVTEGTLDNPDEAGRLRVKKDEPVRVVGYNDNTVLHIPPEPDELQNRLKEMCNFANNKTPGRFLHPVLRAIMLHFWLSYDHPFTDGNGRTARALFYWSMLKQDYWICEFISISKFFKDAPAKYAKSFLYTETDDNDLTYFLCYNLEVFKKATEELFNYINRKSKEIAVLENRSLKFMELNHRQKALISHALRYPDGIYTFLSHKTSHGIVHQTARNDLLELENKGYLIKTKKGKTYYFRSSPDLVELLTD